MSYKAKILIVEDEILIADTIKGYLEAQNYEVTAIAISYDEAIVEVEKELPDLVLLDIRLNGEKNGIAVGQYLTEHSSKIPHIYLSSQTDKEYLERAKSTLPEAFLTKPIQKLSMFMTVEVVLHNRKKLVEKHEAGITLKDFDYNKKVLFKEILYVSAEHVYLRFHLTNKKSIVIRNSMKWILDQLPESDFIQVHRSFVVNLGYVKEWNNNELIIDEKIIPISRARRKFTIKQLQNKNGYTYHS